MENLLFTDKLQEKIYYGNSTYSTEEIIKEINTFLNEVVRRRRNDEEEEGLQAVLVIGKEEFGAKITENDGSGFHQNSSINIIKYFNHDNNYISLEGTGYPIIYKPEDNQLCEETIQISILSANKIIKFIINPIFSKYIQLSEFQDRMIKILLEIFEELKHNNISQRVEIINKFPKNKESSENNNRKK